MIAKLELFHRIADPASARVRSRISELKLEDRIRFRNVAFEEAQVALAAAGGKAVPSLLDGTKLFEGEEHVLSRLSEFQA